MQSSSRNVTTNKPTPSFFTGRMPFLAPNQHSQSTEGKPTGTLKVAKLQSNNHHHFVQSRLPFLSPKCGNTEGKPDDDCRFREIRSRSRSRERFRSRSPRDKFRWCSMLSIASTDHIDELMVFDTLTIRDVWNSVDLTNPSNTAQLFLMLT